MARRKKQDNLLRRLFHRKARPKNVKSKRDIDRGAGIYGIARKDTRKYRRNVPPDLLSEAFNAEHQIVLNYIDFYYNSKKDFWNRVFTIIVTAFFGVSFALMIIIIASLIGFPINVFSNVGGMAQDFNIDAAIRLDIILYYFTLFFIVFHFAALEYYERRYLQDIDSFHENIINELDEIIKQR